jgi:serine/threonine protein kinase
MVPHEVVSFYIVLDNEGMIRVCDFGICRSLNLCNEIKPFYCGSTMYIMPNLRHIEGGSAKSTHKTMISPFWHILGWDSSLDSQSMYIIDQAL